ncbi:MAG: hypothetical protein M0Z54_13075 [Thermaerobacter sp.]|nr:hypothetical protein [Thermaerobacter sp.]
MRWQARWAAVAALLLSLTLLAGCWDQKGISDRAAALMVSIAWNPSGRSDWTFYFPNPTVTVNSQSQIKSTQQLYTVAVAADSWAGAERAAQRLLDRHLYLGQLKVLLWSSNLPADAAATLVDAYNRQGISSKVTYVGVAQAPSLPHLLQASPQEVVPRLKWQHVFSCAPCEAIQLSEPFWHVWDDVHTPGMSPVAPYITSSGALSQIAVYGHRGPPVIFTPQQTLGWALLTSRVTREVLTLSRGGERYAVTGVHGRATTRVAWTGGPLQVDVHVAMSGALAQAPYGTAGRPADIRAIETTAARLLLADCEAAVREANARHVDPFGYARSLLFAHPEWVHHPGLAWPALSSHVAFTVSFNLTTPGVTT